MLDPAPSMEGALHGCRNLRKMYGGISFKLYNSPSFNYLFMGGKLKIKLG